MRIRDMTSRRRRTIVGGNTPLPQYFSSEINFEKNNSLMQQLGKTLRENFKKGMVDEIVNKISKFQDAKVDLMIKQHKHLIRLINAPASAERNDLIRLHLSGAGLVEPPSEGKPNLRELARTRKQKFELAHRKVVADSYLKQFNEISHETVDYYKQKTINTYITEQFCKGDRFF